jgi:hypothetical protein
VCDDLPERSDPHAVGKARLGWRSWPTVYFYAVWNGIVAAWRLLREGALALKRSWKGRVT